MAFYILIEKLSETNEAAVFRFYDTAYPDEIGELTLDKRNEEITMTKPSRESFFQRAARKVASHYREGNLPEQTCWAS